MAAALLVAVRIAAAAAGALVVYAYAFAQTTGPQTPPLVIPSMYGRDLFEFYCAPCHGRDGRGGGPAAAALKVPPSDLATIALRNGGAFPRARIESVVRGGRSEEIGAHGSKDMPVWGPIFGGLDRNQQANTVRVTNIVGYIESLQAK